MLSSSNEESCDENTKWFNKDLSLRQYAISRISEKKDSLLQYGRKLFQQFVIDLWLQIEKHRLDYIKYNQHLFFSDKWSDQHIDSDEIT